MTAEAAVKLRSIMAASDLGLKLGTTNHSSSAVIAFVILCWSPLLHAQQSRPNPQTPSAATHTSEAERGFSFGATLATSYENEVGSRSAIFAPLLEGVTPVYRQIFLDLTWGAAWMIDTQGLGESTARIGNPMSSVLLKRGSGQWSFVSGWGFTLPTAHVSLGPDGRLQEFVYNQTMAMWGMWNLWLWSPDRMAVPFTGRVGYGFLDDDSVSLEAGLAPMFGVRISTNGFSLVEQLAVEARLPVLGAFALCPRLQTVHLPSSNGAQFQSAAGLRVTIQTNVGRFFVGGLVNLDGPLGVFGGLQRWSVQLGKEVDL